MARITNTVERKMTDENGEIIHSEEEKTINWGAEPNYIKLYLDDVLYLSDLPKGLNSILYAFLKRMSYGNQLVINAALKRQVAKEVDLSVSSINNAITNFVKEEHTSELQSRGHLVCRLLLEKKKKINNKKTTQQ